MPKNTRMDLLNAIAALKRADRKAYDGLLRELKITSWREVCVDDFENVIATCTAKIGEIEMSGEEIVAELADDPKLGVHDTLDRAALDRNAKSEINAGIDDDLRTVINGAPDLATGFARASAALFARNRNRANATAAK